MIIKNNKYKIFCLSIQRTGTTSLGVFFKNFGYKVADWSISERNKWSFYWEQGDFESIFNSKDFKKNQVFEDNPWWLPEFYKILYHRFPNSKFILFTRDSDSWFNSMLNHSNGKTLGNTKLHCKVFRRESDFYNVILESNLFDYDETAIDNLLSLKGYEEHYKSIYDIRNKEIVDFFNKTSPKSLFVCQLEDSLKWKKLGQFVDINISKNYDVHVNKSI